jgi:antitoxin CptB
VTGRTLSTEGLDERRRRLLFRCWHRGVKEMDLIMGGFADAHLKEFSDADVAAFETLMLVPDQQMYAWVTGTEAVAREFDTPMFRRLRDFHMSNTDTI